MACLSGHKQTNYATDKPRERQSHVREKRLLVGYAAAKLQGWRFFTFIVKFAIFFPSLTNCCAFIAIFHCSSSRLLNNLRELRKIARSTIYSNTCDFCKVLLQTEMTDFPNFHVLQFISSLPFYTSRVSSKGG